MKRILLVAFALVLVAGVALADEISVFADQAGSSCTFNFTTPALYNAYVVHKTVAGATGSQFKVVNNTGVAFSAVVMNGYLSIGDAFTDLSLAYGGCLAGPNIAVVQLSGAIFAAPSADCLTIEVVPAPNKVGVLVVGCTFEEIPAYSEPFQLGSGPTSECACITFATEQSTWGRVKSLYR